MTAQIACMTIEIVAQSLHTDYILSLASAPRYNWVPEILRARKTEGQDFALKAVLSVNLSQKQHAIKPSFITS